VQLQDDGKAAFADIYSQPDPRGYFGTLRKLDYRIPQLAKPHFEGLIDQLRDGAATVSVLDIGCSYGINAALLRCDASMDELYDRYCGIDASTQTRGSLLAHDRELVQSRAHGAPVRFVGLDVSRSALSYAVDAGFLDDAVCADLEADEPTAGQRERLAGADLVTSTGCIGYVTEQTIGRVVRAQHGRRPWMAHFVLRMYPFDAVAECLRGFGYETVRVDRAFKQRRFASPQEQAQVLDTLSEIGVDPRGLEVDGWLYAQLFVSRPSVRTAANRG
jgi:carnitine O-acetyltransferase